MNIKELMIGDWIAYHGAPQQVIYLNLDDGDRVATTKQYFAQIIDCWEPVPLTEEILQKNFPDPSEIVWFPLDTMPGFFNIYWEHPSFGDGELRLNIQYVHELQHIVRMVGLTKEIEL